MSRIQNITIPFVILQFLYETAIENENKQILLNVDTAHIIYNCL